MAEQDPLEEAAANEALAHFRVTGSGRGQPFALDPPGVNAIRRGAPSRALEAAGEAVVLARAAGRPVLQPRIADTPGMSRLRAGIAEAIAPCDAVPLFERADAALHAAKAAGCESAHNDLDARHGRGVSHDD